MLYQLIWFVENRSDGDLIPRGLVHSVVSLLETFAPASHSSLYVGPLIATSHLYYQAEGVRLMAELDSSAYLSQVARRMGEEADRARLVLGPELEDSLQQIVLDETAAGHVETIVEKDLSAMITEERKADLTSVYSLLSRVASVAPLRAAFLEYIKVRGGPLSASLVFSLTLLPRLDGRLLDLRLFPTALPTTRWLNG